MEEERGGKNETINDICIARGRWRRIVYRTKKSDYIAKLAYITKRIIHDDVELEGKCATSERAGLEKERKKGAAVNCIISNECDKKNYTLCSIYTLTTFRFL